VTIALENRGWGILAIAIAVAVAGPSCLPLSAADPQAGPLATPGRVSAWDSSGPIKLKRGEQIAILFLAAFEKIEGDCQSRLKHTCTLQQLVAGPLDAGGSLLGRLKFDPASDPNFSYTLVASGMKWEAHADARMPGLRGFCAVSEGLPLARFTHNPTGRAGTADKMLSCSYTGDFFAVR